MTSSPNRRRHSRVQVDLHCVASADIGGSLRVRGTVTNISMSGLYVTTDKILPIGQKCQMRILLGDERVNPAIEVEGRITRSDREGMGIEFVHIPASSLDHLKNLVLYSSDDPDKLENELGSF